jgi:hypothetical protein
MINWVESSLKMQIFIRENWGEVHKIDSTPKQENAKGNFPLLFD